MAKQRKEPSQKQKEYAENIAKALNIKLPEENTSAAYRDFISKNQERFAQSRPAAVHFTDEQINRANAVDIVGYAHSMGLELKRDGKDYRVKNYSGGFIISPEKNNWNWFEGDQGGDVVQLCMFLEDKTWQEAVGTLINEDMEPIRRAPDWKPKEEPPKEFNLPPKNNTDRHVYAYLIKTRGIDVEIVKDMLDKGYIYENQYRSCVFVGRDNEGVPRHASVRSTNTTGTAYKKDVSGSQKKYSFSISGTSGILNVFEAPIDALSYMSLQKLQGKPLNDSYVALGGVTDKALERYLEDHKDIQQITVCTDGDEAGEKAADRISEKYGEQYKIVRQRSQHKDFNEDLTAIMQEENFKRSLHEVVAGKSRVSDSILIGKTPNILVACGAAEGLDFTISKNVIDKCTRPEIRDADGKLTGKTGHGLTEEQLYSALMNVKEPVMVLKGNRENSLVIITEYPDDKNRPIVVSVVLDKQSGRTMINNVSSVYGRDKFEEYIKRQIQEDNILAFDNKKAEPLLQPIGKWYPKRGEVFSYDATIAYSMESVKYPENISKEEVKEMDLIRDKDQIENIMKKLDAFAKTADEYERFADKDFQENLYQILREHKKVLQDNPDGIVTLQIKFYEESNPNELNEKPDLWNEFWNYLERYGVTGDERFSDRLNRIAAQPETMKQAFSIMKDIKEYLDDRLYMTSYMRGDVAVNEDIASYYLGNAYRYLNEEYDDPERNQDMLNQIEAVQDVFSLDEASTGRFYTTNLGGNGWGSGKTPYFYITEDMQSSFEAAYASYMASDEDGRVIGYSNAGMSTAHLVELAGYHYADTGRGSHTLNHHLENQIFDEDSKVLADIEKRLYEELKQQNEVAVTVQEESEQKKANKEEDLINNTNETFVKKRLFVDLDGTCALWQPVAEEELYEQGYYRNLPPYENVVKAVNELVQENSDIEVYVLSKYLTGSKYALHEKEEWVKEHLPNIPIENQIYVPYSKDKKDLIPGGLRETDYLLDDFTNNFDGWQPPAKAVKLLNGINNTKGKWQENKISAFRSPEALKKGLYDIVINGEVIKDLPPQLDNTFDYEAFYDERQGYKYSNFADNHKELLEEKAKRFNNRKTIVINAFGGAGAGKTVSCMDICQQLKKAGYNAEYVSEYCKDLVYENSDMLDGSAKNQFKILQEQMRRVDRLIGQVDFIVTDSPVLLNSVYNEELTPEYEEMVDDIFKQYQNFSFMIQRDETYYQTEGRIHTLEESMEKDNQIREMLQSRDVHFETYNHEEIHEIVESAIQAFETIPNADENTPFYKKSFAEQVDEVLAGTANQYNALKVCDTPPLLINLGCRQLPMLYTQRHLKNALKQKDKNHPEYHGLSKEEMKKLPDLIQEPVMVFDSLSRNDSVVIVTSAVDSDNAPILVSFKPDGKGTYELEKVDSNFITSVYGKDNNFSQYIERIVESDNMLYCDIEKSQELFRVSGLQLPGCLNNLGFDKIIHQSKNIVNQNNVSGEIKPDISISNYESNEPNQVNFDVNIGEDEVHKGEAAFDDDGTVNWIFVDPVPADDGTEATEQQDTAKALKLDWDKIVSRVKELLQDLRYKSREFMHTIGAGNTGRTYTQGAQPGSFSEYRHPDQEQQSAAQEAGQNKNSPEQEKPASNNAAEENIKETVDSADRNNTNPDNKAEQYKQFADSHKELVSASRTKRKPLVINAFGGPGSGKSTSCMDICQQLKKQGYKTEYVMEYAKDLVYDKNEKLLDGSPESQFEVLKEQLKRVDRLYNSGEVDFIVTDSPVLLNEIYNKSLTDEYDSMVTSLYNDFDNFAYWIERDTSEFQKEGRIHNLEQSQEIDGKIKKVLEEKKIRYETYNHDTVDKIVSDAVHAFNRLNDIDEAATEKQKAYAEKIAETLGITLPEKATKAAYRAFINENQEAFSNSNAPLKAEGADAGSYQDYLEMVTKDGSRLTDVPKEHYTDELLLAAVHSWGAAVRRIPEDRITAEIAMASVQQYGLNLKYVPEKLKNEEICVAAYINSSGKSVRYTPRDIKDKVKEEGQKRLAEDNSTATGAKRQINSGEIQQQGQEWAARIDNILKEHETNPDAIVEDIAFASKFYQYSTRNIQLMRQQNPGITYVASASAFEKMNYHVKPGEKAMIGRVPEFSKYIINEKGERVYSGKYTPEIKQKLKEGTLKEEQVVKKFNYVAAFYDISQTDCPVEDYPSAFHMGIPSELHQDAFDAMKKFVEEHLGFKVMVTDLKSISLRGSCEPDNKIIRINDRLEATMALSTLCHEIAHGIIHTSENSAKMSTAQKECEADVMDIMLESSLGLAINENRRNHLFKSFQTYKEEQAAKEHPYEVTMEKIIDRVQSKVFRTYIDDINIYLDKYLPAEGSRNQEAAKEVVRNLALLDYNHGTNHEALIDVKNELFDRRKIEDYRELYQKEKDEIRMWGSFMPKLAILQLARNGSEQVDIISVQTVSDNALELILNHPEQVKPEEDPHVPVKSIAILKENALSKARFYRVIKDEGFKEFSEDEDTEGFYEAVKNRIDSNFDIQNEYQCIHSLLENGMELNPQIMKKYKYICRAYDYPKNAVPDSGMRLMARINMITEGLSQNNRDMVAEYVFRTGNYEKAEQYAAKIGREQDVVRKMRQEMRLVDSYKYMLRTIAEYENNNDILEKHRLTTGAYNASGIPVLSENVSSLSQINEKFVLIRKYASPESVKYYSIVEDAEQKDVYRIAYVELNEYEPEVEYSAVTFKGYEEAREFYDQYLGTGNSRLADSSQVKELAALENRENQIALSEITSIGKTIASGKQSYMDSGLDEEAALEMLRMEISKEHSQIKPVDAEMVQQELQNLKDFKKMVNSYGRERFIELSNLDNLKETDVSLKLGKWLTEQKDTFDKMSVTGIDDVKRCVDSALDSSVTAADLEQALNAIDSAVLSAEFSGLETEFEGFEEYNDVLDTLKAAQVTPDKFCYVDFGAEPGPYLYTSDIAGNIYRKSLSGEDGSVQDLNTRLKEAGYEICSSLDDFRAYAANNRLGIFNVPEKEKNEAFIRILESTNDRLPKGQVLSVYDFKDTIDKLSAAADFHDNITYSLVTRKDQEINSYIDTYSGNSDKNVYEQLYEKAQEKVPELSRVISRQYYQDQINFNERYQVRPLLQQLKKENKSVEDSEELGSVMESNARLEKIIKELDLSPADAELLKLNAGTIRTQQSADIQAQQQMNQQTQQRKMRSQQQDGISM